MAMRLNLLGSGGDAVAGLVVARLQMDLHGGDGEAVRTGGGNKAEYVRRR
jgi:hypothetical protein